ncbi:single-stranded DNA-binding protein [Shewanella oncorhynchi]|uniref:single-stranded DNA-binding protein n=1 Tax=Shewanella TaxID=22 RepID=UPI0021D7DB5A|nr:MULTISPECIES: single-stranded DNA-binding protein [unclassified Shewanella]MCU7988123.1 single-stranded DNA-binding protein [Shewanella sp. SW24]MCU8014038.1 single-stranded DNA-binding protein [Shewanella sp. SM74]MCU8019220.1 single-stranded DNA-binding protein [Shewanella sp. SM72]MCU8023113.1 single-stranded DNA-binding protein [Shewanella sp. SM78]MCU8040729.1 single-stranded DNA-binding protein [Shewanella sp. SM69]
MGSVNKVIIVGNIGQDIDFKTLPSGSSVANFSVATSDTWKDQAGIQQEVTDWHKIVVWGKLAEIINQYGGKGRQVYIEGKQKTRKYKDANGQDRYTTEVVVDFDGQVQLLGSSQKDSAGQSSGYQQNAPQQQGYQQNAPQQQQQQQQQGGYQPQPQGGYPQNTQKQNYNYRR